VFGPLASPLRLLCIYRHDRGRRALVTLAGVIDPATAPQVRTVLERCLHETSI
jgi:hypothetical protein